MIKSVPPAFLFILGALLIPVFKEKLKPWYLLAVPIIAFVDLVSMETGANWVYPFLNYELIFAKVDRLSVVVGYIFILIGFLAILYSIRVRENGQQMAAFLYVGSSLGVVFAGDYFTLFAFWEIMAMSSVFLIWYRREKESLNAGFRYLLMHLFGGGALLIGILIHAFSKGSISVGPLEEGWAFWFILIGFGLNAAFIPLHTWLPDAYPKGTVTGSVFLSVYTTKTGVYALARCFPGVDFVAYMGGVMAIYGIVFALLQNDTRRFLSYHIVSQVGYMVAGVGTGVALGVNGGIAHVFNHILYKALLFMCMGSILAMAGKSKLTELGGLARKMPLTCITCLVASLSIAGVPPFNGFVSKGMVISAAVEANKPALELLLTLASVGTFLSFSKLCYYTFFAKNEAIQAEDPPWNMQLAMGMTAFLCILYGVYPQALFNLLPAQPVSYHPYTASHVVGVFQLFLWGWVVFTFRKVIAPEEGTVLDLDYFYRMCCRG
ncbi:MAG TPA: Na(+)/H(+) antiporter subunit D, partial [Thermodesulfobacteriota bacterium]|nr:Na(+)/H(+) antiporter subunit D [Thermodesulfobacteriota bacterium]